MISKQWLIITIFTFITIVAWVVFDILHARSQVEVPQKLQQIIEPISPQFQTGSIESIP